MTDKPTPRPVDAIFPGRIEAITEHRCMAPPIGCGKPVDMEDFRYPEDRAEYGISGLCQDCQDKVFT
jgi:hypothetical protein